MLHISGYGQTGPYNKRPGMGTLAEAFSGFAYITGEADGPPTLPSVPIADGVASLSGMQRFHEFDVVAGPIYDVGQIFNDPQVQHRETFTETADAVLGKVRVQNVVPRFKRNPGRIRWLGKAEIGADTEAVLGELGYSHEEIEGLSADGVIKTPTASGRKK